MAILAILLCAQIFGQTVPPSSMFGPELRTWIKQNWYDCQFSDLGYNSAREQMYSFTDEVAGSIQCVYTQFQQAATLTTFPDPINAEHIIPQSFYGGVSPMKSDIHNLRPCHGSANSARSNSPYMEVADAGATWYGIDETGNYFSTTTQPAGSTLFSERISSTWEPPENRKGDVARQVFYFYTMYPTEAGVIELIADPAMLLQWHNTDPVDSQELERNDRIELVQGNRNPYIDYPEVVYQAWFEGPVPGCTDVDACNYNPGANTEDNSCDYSTCVGCTYALADNYNPLATKDDGSCDFTSLTTDQCTEDLNDDALINVTDLLILMAAYGSICP